MTWFVLRTEQTEKLEKIKKLKKSHSKPNVFDEDSTDSERSEDLKESSEFVSEETLMNQDSDLEKNEEK